MVSILDHLALGRTGEVADVAPQRLKTSELVVQDGNWARAFRLELVPTEVSLLASKDEQQMVIKELEMRQKLPAPRSSASSWRKSGSGKGAKADHGSKMGAKGNNGKVKSDWGK